MRFLSPRLLTVPACASVLWAAAGVSAQIVCDQPGVDATIGALAAPNNYASLNGTEAFAIGASICNVGSEPLAIIAAPSNQHPVFAQHLYRLKTVDGAARFEQIGMSWSFHLFAVLQQSLCCQNCVPSDSQHLGVRCSCPEPSSFAGAQSFLAPRWQVNAATGLRHSLLPILRSRARLIVACKRRSLILIPRSMAARSFSLKF